LNEDPKTILVVVPSLAGGGAERAVSWLTREWSKNHRVVTAVFNAADRVYESGGTFVDLDAASAKGAIMRLYTAARRVLLIRRLIRETQPDRIFGFMESANLSLILAALACGMRHRVTLSIRGNPDRMCRSHKVLVPLLYPLAGRVAAVSAGVGEALSRRLAPGVDRIRVLYSPLPLGEIRALSEEPVDEGLLPPGVPYFFAAGRLVPGKDFARLVDLFADLCTALDRPDLRPR
jgi:glycosyltransferase involved in cell wall biosynthesis